MGLFTRNKKNETAVVWRDSNGKINCSGDNCPKDCDDTCPIYLNTQAMIIMQIGQGPKAIDKQIQAQNKYKSELEKATKSITDNLQKQIDALNSYRDTLQVTLK